MARMAESIYVGEDFKSFQISERDSYTLEGWRVELTSSEFNGKLIRNALRQFIAIVDANGLHGEAAYYLMRRNAGRSYVAQYINQSNESWKHIRGVLDDMKEEDDTEEEL